MEIVDGTDPVLRNYLRVARKRGLWIALAALLGLGASLGLSLTSAKQYAATAQLLVQPSGAAAGSSPAQVTTTDVQTDIQLVTSAPVRQIAARQLGGNPSVSAAQVAQTNVISITAIAAAPQTAAQIANVYGRAFVSYRQQEAIATLDAAEAQLSKQISSLDSQARALRLRPGNSAQLAAVLNQEAVEKQQLAQMQVYGASGTIGGVSFVTPALPPASPSSPKPVQDGLLGLLAGLILGVGLAFLLENFDDTVTSTEVAEQFGGTPVLSMIPVVPSWKRRDQPVVVSLSQPVSPAAESYRSLRTSLQFIRQERELRTLLVTSATAAEGKTSTVANLGVVFAQAGERVLLVSTDLRRPRLGMFFGLDEEVGFTSVLLGQRPLQAAIQRVSGIDALWLLGAGRVPPNPAELLSGYQARALFQALRADFDIVLIDSPPVLPVTDAAVLSKYADAAIIVSSAGQTKRVALKRAADKLGQVNAAVVGQVLGEVTRQTGYGYGDGSGYGYSDAYKPLPQRLPEQSQPRSSSQVNALGGNGSVSAGPRHIDVANGGRGRAG